MEFTEVVRRRRMVRSYAPTPVDPAVVDRALAHAVRAPSAGFTQGWAFVVLDTPADVRRFWRATAGPIEGAPEGAADGAAERAPAAPPNRWLAGMMTAPVIVLPCSSKAAYLERYAEPDKGWTDHDESRWAMPYWHLDAAMASLLVLLTAVDEGLGGCFFGVPPHADGAVRREFAIPEDHDPVGVIALGHPAAETADTGSAGSPARRARRPLSEVVHRGGW